MSVIGLLMVNDEDDILERTLELNTRWLDWFYVLDGTQPNGVSHWLCTSHPKCAGYSIDTELPRPPYPTEAVCGYRNHIHRQAVRDHGPDNWFMVLHADEVWPDPAPYLDGPFDGWTFLLPFFFPRAGETWDASVHPLRQLRWRLGPGFPEFRLFRGNPDVAYDPKQRMNTRPDGLRQPEGMASDPILHYPYRAPDVQRLRAATHERTQFDPDNYRHITDGDAVYWDDAMIGRYQEKACFAELAYA